MRNENIWGAAINLSGVWGPVKMSFDHEGDKFYDKNGNLSVDKIGKTVGYGVIEFGSRDKKEVEIWVDGVKSAMKILERWCS